jgi:coenzyme F420 biosynthesis associated uncharacterized protein
MAADTQTTPPVDQIVDWDLAARTAARVGRSGPDVSQAEAEQIVGQLRRSAVAAHPHVQAVTGLHTVAGENVLVVDRAGWAKANIAAFRTLLDPVITEVYAKRDKPPPSARIAALGSRVTGAEVGGLLGILSSRVLGQYDAFAEQGRLLLVAPTIVAVERELGVDPTDFRLWVCLHEETHRVQFTAVPWMRDHLFTEFTRLADTVEPQRLLDDGLKRIAEAIKNGRSGSLLDLMGSPEQKVILDRVTGVMSLLEGHADYVMDGVGPGVIPTVDAIRAKFDERRKGLGTLDRLLRRLLGLEAKMAQYRDGARFVRAVVDKVGMDGFNAVWSSAELLPSLPEIHDPDAWIARVHR